MKNILCALFLHCFCTVFALNLEAQKIPNYSPAMQQETLGRGLVAYRKTGASYHYISWRYLKTDPVDIAFNLYAASYNNGVAGIPVLVNPTPITNATFFSRYYTAEEATIYYLKEIRAGVELDSALASYVLKSKTAAPDQYIEIPMKPVNAMLSDGTYVWSATAKDSATSYNYIPNDASFADLDGDGEMEIVVHRVGPRAQDNANGGKTDAPVLQAYKLDGTFMWEINLGPNIREGAHYTQFMVYDLDGDGKAEVVCKTAEGSRDALGTWVGEAYAPTYKQKFNLTSWTFNPNVVYRNGSGYILTGPEFLTVFNGETGAEIVTTEYDPPRYSTVYNGGNEVPVLNPSTSNINTRWGDNYGNRVDRFLACIAYLDGIHPSVVMCRGYYTRSVLVAYDFDGTNLTKRWKFDTYNGGNTAQWSAYAGQGNHNLRVGDVDGDGKDEIVYGSMTVDDNGIGLYNTRLGHGDALHLTDFIPERPGMEVLAVHENKVDGTTLRDARTGEIIFQIKSGDDVGRGMGTDVTAAYRGMEWWSSRSDGVRSSTNNTQVSTGGVSMNMACWWDGDLLRELQDGTSITKYSSGSATTLLSPSGVGSNNSTKANPCIVADILGDWREEMVVRTTNNRAIRIYMTDKATNYRFHSFLQDPVYRASVAYQNVAYNQPTHTGFYMGSDLTNIFVPTSITVADSVNQYVLNPFFDAITYQWSDGCTNKTDTLRRADFPDGQARMVKLTMNYQGFLFSDSISVTFTQPEVTVAPALPQNAAVKLLNTQTEQDLHIAFTQPGLYDCFIYDLTGKTVMKTTLPVGAASTHTLDADMLPAGNYILKIEHNFKHVYTEKFLKK